MGQCCSSREGIDGKTKGDKIQDVESNKDSVNIKVNDIVQRSAT